MSFKDLSKDSKKGPSCFVDGPDCKESSASTEFSKELSPKTDSKEDSDSCCKK